jgi:hypothetical protein
VGTFVLTLPPVTAGWTVRLYNALSGGTLITQRPWTTPEIAGEQSAQFLLEITPSASASATYDVLVKVSSGPQKIDAVKVTQKLQKIAKIQIDTRKIQLPFWGNCECAPISTDLA